MDELDIAQIKKKSIHGIFALTSRTFLVQIVNFAANFLLTIFLAPSVFGIFFIVSAIINFLSYFSDVGLAAALIQKKEEITRNDLKTTFTIQQALVLSLVVIALIFSNAIGDFYNLDSNGVFLFQALAVSFFLSSLKTIPSVLLERNLDFTKLVIPQLLETIVFNIVAVILAIKGFGIASFSYAVLARGITGLITIYIISPWRISFGFSKESAKNLMSFGIPFQLNSFLALIKDDLFVAFLGKILPFAQVGYIGFAQKWAFMPLRLIMDNVIRITFPSFSRLQEEKDLLSKAVEKSIFAATFIIFPALTGLVILSTYFIDLIPRYSKWEPAVMSLIFFALNAALSSISTPLTNALNAIGKIKITLYFMVFWTTATWILSPILIMFYGFNGVSIASFLIATSTVLVIWVAKTFVKFNILKVVLYPTIASFTMAIAVIFLAPLIAVNLLGLIMVIVIGAVVYFAIIFVIGKQQLIADLALVRENIKM